jgi:metal-sulfur cluster biosynthetic enzyme
MKYFTDDGRWNGETAGPIANKVRDALKQIIDDEPLESVRELELVIDAEVIDMILARVISWS